VAQGTDYDSDRILQFHPTWTTVPAVAGGRMYGIDASLLLRAGPRLVDGAYRLAQLLHPHLAHDTGDDSQSRP
jgi:iron complex transport system substrate-binding protein